MATYRFKCLDCENRFDWHNIPLEERDVRHPECPKCNSVNNKRIIPDRIMFAFQETNADISAKPDSYWENAERNRLAAKKKRDAEFAEKMRYDEAFRQKQERKQAAVVDED